MPFFGRGRRIGGMTAIEQVIDGEGFSIGHFWCPPDSPLWRCENVIERGPIFVFPMTGVEIEHPDDRPIVTSSARTLFYNYAQPYRRRLLDRGGDRCLYFAVAPDVVRDALSAHGASMCEEPRRPFAWTWGPLHPRVYLAAMELFRHVMRRGRADDDAQERVFALLDAVVGATAAWQKGIRRSRVSVGHRARDAVDDTLRYLILHLDRATTLPKLGRRVGLSPFHLARSFRACTGLTLHECRDRMRVMDALNRLDGTTRLGDLALDVGYSSNSHLTQAFQRMLGETPSEVRRRLADPIRA